MKNNDEHKNVCCEFVHVSNEISSKKQPEPNFEFVYFQSMGRVVVRNDMFVYKVEPHTNHLDEDIHQALLAMSITEAEVNSRFVFWESLEDDALQASIIDFVHQTTQHRLKRDKRYLLSKAKYRGTSCQTLFQGNERCRSHDISTIVASPSFTIAQSHASFFFDFLGHSLKMLSDAGYVHNDIRLANILLDVTPEEKVENCISTSLPLLIDFGQSQKMSSAKAAQNAWQVNMCDFAVLFACCPEGSCIYDDEDNRWIERIVQADSTSVECLRCITSFVRQRNYPSWIDSLTKLPFTNLLIQCEAHSNNDDQTRKKQKI